MISNARELGEREDTPEEDSRRVQDSERMYLGKIIERLISVNHLQKGTVRAFVIEMDRKLNVFRDLPSNADIAAIKKLAWESRQFLPRALAPKLPPHDPVVREMGL